MSTRSFAFSVVLATYLAGLVVGSALYARLADRVSEPWGIFGLLLAAAGLVALLEIAGLGKWLVVLQTEAEGAVLALTGSQLVGMCTRVAVAAALLRFPGLEKRVCAELLPAVVRAAPLFQGNFGAASDPRIETRVRDGRRELLQNPERYDLITLEPPPPSASGVVNLYSSDFYALAGTRLRPGGLFAQWLPLPTQNDED